MKEDKANKEKTRKYSWPKLMLENWNAIVSFQAFLFYLNELELSFFV